MPTLSARFRDCVLVPEETYLFNSLVQVHCLGPVNTHDVFTVLLIEHLRGFDFYVSDRRLHTLVAQLKLVKTHGCANDFPNTYVPGAWDIYL